METSDQSSNSEEIVNHSGADKLPELDHEDQLVHGTYGFPMVVDQESSYALETDK